MSVLTPPDDLVMVVDDRNTAHVLRPAGDRPVFHPTICGGQYNDLAALHQFLDTLSAPWSLLTDRTYRAWPPWPCQTCVGLATTCRCGREDPTGTCSSCAESGSYMTGGEA